MNLDKAKKIIFSLVVIIFMILGLGQNLIYAASGNLTAQLEVYRRLPKYDSSTKLYTQESTNWGFELYLGGHPVYQISEVDSSNNFIGDNARLYCLNAEEGTTWDTSAIGTNLIYDTKSNLKDANEVNTDVGTNSVYDISKYDYYSSIIWLLDNFYIPNKTDKESFMANIGIVKDNSFQVTINGTPYNPYYYSGTNKFVQIGREFGYNYVDATSEIQDVLLTDELIETVQQAVIWYFTNYLDNNIEGTNTYNCYTGKEATSVSSWLFYTQDGENYYGLSDSVNGYKVDGNDGDSDGKVNIGAMYQEQASILYNYLVDKALEAKDGGYTGTETKPTITIDKSLHKVTQQTGGEYVIEKLIINSTNNVSNIELTIKDMDDNDITSICTIPEIIKGTEFSITVPETTNGNVKITAVAEINGTKQTLWTKTGSTEQPIVEIEPAIIETDPVTEVITNEQVFDLALRKIITGVKKASGTSVSILNEDGLPATRMITADTTSIPNTATYKHRKDPVVVSKGYKVTYQLNIYNEGDIDGYASIIVDQLPTGLVSTLEVGDTVTSSKENIYQVKSYDNNKLVLELVQNTVTKPIVISAYNNTTLDKDSIDLECEVTQVEDKDKHYLTNIAYINEAYGIVGGVATKQEQDRKNTESKPAEYPNKTASDLNNTTVTYQGGGSKSIYDDTNNEYYYEGQQDDDDFETIVLLPKEFDLKLIKYISAVNGNKSNRVITVNSSNLNKTVNGTKITTADYNVSKLPITVKTGDYVTYTFRIYNEAEIDGYASEITEDIPAGLEYIYSTLTDEQLTADTTLSEEEKEAIEFNRNYGWTFTNSDLTSIKTNYLSNVSTDNLIKAFDGTKLDYKEVSVMFKVTSTDVTRIIRNEVAITEDTDEDGASINDRDSDTKKWNKEDSDDYYDNEHYPKYKEDDEDYDNIKLVRFDLALRKHIIAVSDDATIDAGEYINTKVPQIDISKLKTGEDQTAIYNHSKDAITVNAGDYVVYKIIVYNEGDLDGYASKITDYLPEYLNYIDGEYNKGYGWTYDSSNRSVTTAYLSSANGKDKILEAFDGTKLDYKEVQILCRVSSNAISGENITNIAEITEYQDDGGIVKDIDIDSNPGNLTYPTDVPGYEGDKTEPNASATYYPGQEDDDDFDRVIVLKGSYDVILIKQDENGKQLDSNATFEINGETKEVVGTLIIADDVEINRDNLSKKDTYTIKETIAPDEYSQFQGVINIEVSKKQSSNRFELDKVDYKVTDSTGKEITTTDAKVYLKDGNIYVEVKNYEKEFDLALRKFITKINDTDVTTRVPEVKYENGKITYTHPKDVLKVAVGDTVTYTIRVYNEGKIAGFAETVTDDIPEYLEYLPENATNVAYRWKMYDKDGIETDDVTNAEKIVTDYTSKVYGEKMMQEGENIIENPNLLDAFNPASEISVTNPEYVDVKVAFKVLDPDSSKYIIKNKAQISEDADKNGNPVTDIDSIPNEWNDGEDDQDYENVSVEYFDLALLKYVSEVEVTEKGKTKTIKTGNTGDENDIIPKVEIHKKNLNSTSVKFIYTIKITNEGELPGYATEITDYVPEGLEFNVEDNKGWYEKKDGVIIATELLSDTLLNPGESATVKVTFRWINDEENLGVKTNVAEISKDDNERGILDRDSTPNNKVDGEDDIDDAEVLLSIKTGMTENIVAIITGATIILTVLAGGVILIKKFVL